MINVGNTCYLNASVCFCTHVGKLVNVSTALRALWSNKLVNEVIRTGPESFATHSGLFRELQTLFEQMNVQAQARDSTSVDPTAFVTELARRDGKYARMDQQDAEEFFRDLMKMLERDFGVFAVCPCLHANVWDRGAGEELH